MLNKLYLDYLRSEFGCKGDDKILLESSAVKVFLMLAAKQGNDPGSQKSMSPYKYLSNMFKILYITYSPFDAKQVPLYTALYTCITYTSRISELSGLSCKQYNNVIGKSLFESAIDAYRNTLLNLESLGDRRVSCPNFIEIDQLSNSSLLRVVICSASAKISSDLYTSEQFDFLLKRGQSAFTHDVTDWVFPILPNGSM